MDKKRMTPEEERRRKKLLRLKRLNDPTFTARPDNTELLVRLKELTQYLSVAEISRRSGVPQATLWYQIKGDLKAVHIDTFHAVMKVQLTDEDRATLPPWERVWGGYRIIQGLAAMGWTAEGVSNHTGLTVWVVRAIARTPHRRNLGQISTDVYRKLLRAAGELEAKDPVKDGGCDPMMSKGARVRALRRGSVPLTAWDLDTIHDPGAIPELTGACGTEEGYRIHLRENIDVCDACKGAVSGGRGQAAEGSVMLSFSAWKFLRLMEKRELSFGYVAKELGTRPETVRRWALGEHLPKARYYKDLLRVFDVERDELFDVSESIYEDADFNRITLRAMMDERDIGAHSLAKGSGVSHTAIHNWTTGKKIPKIESIRKVAEYFGVDWEVFYK